MNLRWGFGQSGDVRKIILRTTAYVILVCVKNNVWWLHVVVDVARGLMRACAPSPWVRLDMELPTAGTG
jgi:hypothetical protein